MAETLVNKTQVGSGIWQEDNLIAGSNISITRVPQPIIDSNTIRLYHFDNSLKDEITGDNAFTPPSNTQLSYVTAKFGKGINVKKLSGGEGVWQISPGYNALTQEFTFEWWTSPLNSSIGYYGFYLAGQSTDGKFNIEFNKSREVIKMGGAVSGTNSSSSLEVPLPAAISSNWGNWFHFAYVNTPSKIYIFLNGEKAYETSTKNYDGLLAASIFANSYEKDKPCRMDEVRVSNVARWTSDFTPFSEPYSSGGTAKYAINNTQDISGKQDVLTGATGYDATATQVLKNVNGVLTWVDEA